MRISTLVTLAFTWALLVACAAPETTPGPRTTIVSGETRNVAVREFSEGIDETWPAALHALVREGYQVDTAREHRGDEGVIRVNDVEIRVSSLGRTGSVVRVRAGDSSADENRMVAERILESVEGRVGK